MKRIFIIVFSVAIISSVSCKKYLDIVPDGIATIDNAFTTRYSAQKFLFTCYSYMPEQGSIAANPALTAGEEFFAATSDISSNGSLSAIGNNILQGKQTANAPIAGAWEGYSSLNQPGRSLYQGISDCNIFLENIHKVPDMHQDEKDRWVGEVTFLKAYYHFLLIRQYGPIYLMKNNLPVSTSIAESKVYRNTMDESFEYVESLLDDVLDNESVPEDIANIAEELGRITKGITLAFKAYVQITAASPLFNGNPDYSTIVDNRGGAIFNSNKTESERLEKWIKAAETARQAIILNERLGRSLYSFEPTMAISDETRTKLSIRGAVTENWNSEVIWANPNCWIGPSGTIARYNWPRGLVPGSINSTFSARMNVPLKFVLKFYTKNGVPIEEDLTYDATSLYKLRTATAGEKYYIKPGYTTAGLNFDREPRFYADLFFDGGIVFGTTFVNEEDPLYAEMKYGQNAGSTYSGFYNLTGYTAKKLNHYQTTVASGGTATAINYAWPVIRLADLYLMYAEALNEAGGNKEEILDYVDRVRARAGLNGVERSWNLYSRNQTKPETLEGRREIIQRERTIEMAFEGSGYWDLRRWKKAYDELNKPVTGWNVNGPTPETYYVPVTLVQPVFTMKDYFWPIAVTEMRKNENLVQNLGY